MKITVFIHPHFLIKYYLYRDIVSITSRYSFSGRLLDVGCGEKPYQHLFPKSDYVGVDFPQYSKNRLAKSTVSPPDIFFTSAYKKTLTLPFANASFDHTVSFQVGEHHPDPHRFMSELVRVTKKRGYILLTVPFIWGLHEIPNDYYRYTEYALTHLLAEQHCRVIMMKRQGAFFSTISMISNDYLIELSRHNIIMRITCYLLYPVLLGFSYLAFFLDRIFPSHNIFLNYLILAQKL